MNYPQAFPNYHGGYSRADEGMTLRDYFAAKAMQGIIFECLEPKDTAKFAYELADAMLKERNGNS